MSISIGKFSKSLVLKIFVGIIILPFIFWGMGDVFRGGNKNIIATIDSKKISTQEFINFFNRLNINEEEKKNINNSNLIERVLSEYIGRKIIELEIENLGIELTDKSLRDIIVNDEIFFKDKKFSRTAYEKFLLESGLTAPNFEQNIAAQEKKRQLLTFLSEGILIPKFLVTNEFQKENQIKTIEYVNLDKFYSGLQPEDNEIKEIYEKNKDFFSEKFKKYNFVSLKPENLIGKKEYNEKFFNVINEIENKAFDGGSLLEISKEYKLNIISTNEINSQMIDRNGVKTNQIDNNFFDKIKEIDEINKLKFIDYDNKYFLVEVASINKVNKKVDNKEVEELILNQIKIKNIIENNSEIINKIGSDNFKKKDMIEFASKNNLEIQKDNIETRKKNINFSEDVLKKIFKTNDGEVNLIHNGLMTKNYLVFTEKTKFKKLDEKSKEFGNYEIKAKLNLSKDIYGTYDISVNNKYKIELNNKAINRIKNSF